MGDVFESGLMGIAWLGIFGMLVGGPNVSDVRRLCQLLWLADSASKPAILVGGKNLECAAVLFGTRRRNQHNSYNAVSKYL